MKYNPDSYLLYGTNKAPFPAYPIRLRVVMNDDVQAEALNRAAQNAIRRYPYFAVEVVIGQEGNYDLIPNSRPVAVVTSTKKSLALGSEEVNRHLLFIIRCRRSAHEASPRSCHASTEQRLSKQKYRADTIFFVNYWHT